MPNNSIEWVTDLVVSGLALDQHSTFNIQISKREVFTNSIHQCINLHWIFIQYESNDNINSQISFQYTYKNN